MDSMYGRMLNHRLIGNNNSYLAKDKRNGGVQFSRDPLNLINKNGRKVSQRATLQSPRRTSY